MTEKNISQGILLKTILASSMALMLLASPVTHAGSVLGLSDPSQPTVFTLDEGGVINSINLIGNQQVNIPFEGGEPFNFITLTNDNGVSDFTGSSFGSFESFTINNNGRINNTSNGFSTFDVGGISTININDSSIDVELNNTDEISSQNGFAISVTSPSATTITINNTGVISSNSNDAINFNASIKGGCNTIYDGTGCNYDVNIINNGDIVSVSSTSGDRNTDNDAAIRFGENAITTGSITNNDDITGSSNGIFVSGAVADHNLTIINESEGSIRGDNGSGVVIGGGGVTLNNFGDIVGNTGLTITDTQINAIFKDDSVSLSGFELTPSTSQTVLAQNNSFVNAGSILGTGGVAVDASGAATAFTFNQVVGGSLDGDFVGSSSTDTFNISSALDLLLTGSSFLREESVFFLTDDILSDVNVIVGDNTGLLFEGGNTIEGDLTSNGGLGFLLGEPAVTVTGDVTLNESSSVNVFVGSQQTITSDQQFDLINVGGSLTNNASLNLFTFSEGDGLDEVIINDNSFLLDFVALETDRSPETFETLSVQAITPSEESLSLSSDDENIIALGSNVITAFNSNFNSDENVALTADVFASLQGLNEQEFTNVVSDFLPDLTNAVTQEAFTAIQTANSSIAKRFDTLANPSVVNSTEIASANSATLINAVHTIDDNANSAYLLPVQHHNNANTQGFNTGAWAQVSFTNGDQDNDSNLANTSTGFDSRSENLTLGYDFSISDHSIIGFSATYSDIEIDSERTSRQETDIDTYQITAYGLHQLGAWQFNGQLSYINGDGDSSRTALNNEITNDFDLDGYSLEVGANYTYNLGKAAYIKPLVSLQYANISQDSFTEEGGLNSTVSGSDNDYFEAKLGFKLGEQIATRNSLTDLYLSAAVVSNFGDDDDDITVSFSGFSQTLTTFDADDERLELGLGVNWFSNDNYSIGASINGQVSEDYSNVGGQVKFKYNF